MPGVTRHGDTAGGAIISSQSTVKANSKNIIVHGDSVTPHGDSPHNAANKNIIVHGDSVAAHGTGIHIAPTMIAGSDSVFIGGIAVVNTGDAATCGHTSNGSSSVNVGD